MGKNNCLSIWKRPLSSSDRPNHFSLTDFDEKWVKKIYFRSVRGFLSTTALLFGSRLDFPAALF